MFPDKKCKNNLIFFMTLLDIFQVFHWEDLETANKYG